jgi:heme-degrading monooxygenase HmoA
MIARVWKGATRKEDMERYLVYLKATGLKEYATTQGNLGTYVLTRQVGGNTEFLLLSLWRSMDDIKRFAGKEVEKAVYYPEDKEFLLDMVPTVDHYEIALAPEYKAEESKQPTLS